MSAPQRGPLRWVLADTPAGDFPAGVFFGILFLFLHFDEVLMKQLVLGHPSRYMQMHRKDGTQGADSYT